MQVSAEPDRLFNYSSTARQIDDAIQSEASSLGSVLRAFEDACREPGFQVSVSHLGAHVYSYGSECAPIDNWVGEVGDTFLRADTGSLPSLGSTPVSANQDVDDVSFLERLANFKLPFLVEVGLGTIIIGDIFDLLHQAAKGFIGQEVDKLIVSLAVLGLVAEVGWLSPEPASEVPNATLAFSKTLLKRLPKGASREAIAEFLEITIKNASKDPGALKRLGGTLASLAEDPKTLERLIDHPEVLHVVLSKYGADGVKVASKYGEGGIAFLRRWPDGNLPANDLRSIADATMEEHHLATIYDGNQRWASKYKKLFEKNNLKLDLDSEWNIVSIPHKGPHPNEYHEWVYSQVRDIVKRTRGNAEKFIEHYNKRIVQEIEKNPLRVRKIWYKVPKGL